MKKINKIQHNLQSNTCIPLVNMKRKRILCINVFLKTAVDVNHQTSFNYVECLFFQVPMKVHVAAILNLYFKWAAISINLDTEFYKFIFTFTCTI